MYLYLLRLEALCSSSTIQPFKGQSLSTLENLCTEEVRVSLGARLSILVVDTCVCFDVAALWYGRTCFVLRGMC